MLSRATTEALSANKSAVLTLTIPGQIVPKARPRVTANGTFMPHRYRQWKDQAIAILSSQYQGQPLTVTKSITITLTGKHSRRGDIDNLSGSCLDALVQAGILTNDNLMVVSKLSIELRYGKEEPKTVILV